MTNRLLLLTLLWGTGAIASAQQPKPEVVIKMATLAPKDSLWHRVLQRLAERWRIDSKGRVQVLIYPGGQKGDEPDMLNEMGIGELHAAALTGAGLSGITKGVMALQIPMMFRSYEELDYVWERIAPNLERMIGEKGFVVLNWGDAGWVHFFTTKPAVHPNEMRRLKLFVWAGGDNDELELWRANGFNAQPLAATDIGMSLRSGLIEAVPTTPLYALSARTYELARNMIDLKWAPLVGATVITQSAWNKAPADLREALLKDARAASAELRGPVRKEGDDAIPAMQKVNHLNVIHADENTITEWRKEVENVYPKIRGKIVPENLFDEVKRLRDGYRSQQEKKGQ